MMSKETRGPMRFRTALIAIAASLVTGLAMVCLGGCIEGVTPDCAASNNTCGPRDGSPSLDATDAGDADATDDASPGDDGGANGSRDGRADG